MAARAANDSYGTGRFPHLAEVFPWHDPRNLLDRLHHRGNSAHVRASSGSFFPADAIPFFLTEFFPCIPQLTAIVPVILGIRDHAVSETHCILLRDYPLTVGI